MDKMATGASEWFNFFKKKKKKKKNSIKTVMLQLCGPYNYCHFGIGCVPSCQSVTQSASDP